MELIQTVFTLTEEQMAALRSYAERHSVSMSQVVRDSLDSTLGLSTPAIKSGRVWDHTKPVNSPKIPKSEIETIKALREGGRKLREIAELFGVSMSYISYICRDKRG